VCVCVAMCKCMLVCDVMGARHCGQPAQLPQTKAVRAPFTPSRGPHSHPCPLTPLNPLYAQDHPNEDLYEKSVHMLETYFDIDEGEDQNLAPAVEQVGARSHAHLHTNMCMHIAHTRTHACTYARTHAVRSL